MRWLSLRIIKTSECDSQSFHHYYIHLTFTLIFSFPFILPLAPPLLSRSSRFDELVRGLGKPLPLKIYGLISYIEKNVFDKDDDADQHSGQGNKAKVMRETRAIPKLIMRIENFNKFVICLDKKSNSQELSKRLHSGTVRDFRIKTDELKDAINRTFEEAASDVDENQLDDATDVDAIADETDDGQDNGDETPDL